MKFTGNLIRFLRSRQGLSHSLQFASLFSTSSSTATYSKQTLFPFIKLVHPDLFALHGAKIRMTNLACVQTIYELFEGLEEIERKTSSTGYQQDILIQRPLKVAYELTCYLRSTEQAAASPPPPPRPINFTFRPPMPLTRPHSISSQDIQKSLHHVNLSLSSFFADVGLETVLPLTNPSTTSPSEGPDSPIPTLSTRQLHSLSSSLDCIVFDRSVSARHFGPVSSLRVGPYPPSHSFAGKRSVQRLQAEVSKFIASGRVLVQGLEVGEELAGIERLKQFLLDYGEVLGFSSAAWGDVVLVLYLPAHTVTKNNGGIVCETRDGMVVVKVPVGFKSRALLEAMRVGVPACKMG